MMHIILIDCPAPRTCMAGMTLSLSPTGVQIYVNQHHTINVLKCQYFISVNVACYVIIMYVHHNYEFSIFVIVTIEL